MVGFQSYRIAARPERGIEADHQDLPVMIESVSL